MLAVILPLTPRARRLSAACPNLVRLDASGCRAVSSLGVAGLRTHPHLQCVRLRDMPQVRVARLLASCPRALKPRRGPHTCLLPHMQVDDLAITRLLLGEPLYPSLCRGIATLDISHVPHVADAGLRAIATVCTSLRVLRAAFAATHASLDAWKDLFVARGLGLVEVDVSGCAAMAHGAMSVRSHLRPPPRRASAHSLPWRCSAYAATGVLCGA